MKKEKQDELCKKYPKIFVNVGGNPRETGMACGLEIGDGWYNLIDRLCGDLQWDTDKNEHPQVVADQIKEKFGTLRFYYHTTSETPNNVRCEGKIEGLISFAETMSGYICDVCGAPGKSNKERYIAIRCPNCL